MEKGTALGKDAVKPLEVAAENEEATEAWSGVLFDRFVEYRDLVVLGLAEFGKVAMRMYPPKSGDRVLDVGCGFGDTTQELAGLVGDRGHAVGVDVSEPFIEASIKEAAEAGVENVEFFAADVQLADLGGPYDYGFSRMGVMFFANPVQALRNIRSALRPGAPFVATVWRRKLDNAWVHKTEQVVDQYLEEPEESDEPTCGPGPFSMANADTVSQQLQIAGFEQPTFTRCDLPLKIGDDMDRAVEFNMALGPAAELIRLNGDQADKIRPRLEREISEALAEFHGDNGVSAPASVWIVHATVPE